MRNVRRKSFLRRRMAIALTGICLLAGGCGGEQEEEQDVVLIDHEEEGAVYTTVAVTRADVEKIIKIRCVYAQTNEEEILAEASGKKVEAVYVREGDSVVKGQVLASLTGSRRESEIRELEYRIARNKLLLGYTDTDEAYDLSYRWWDYIYKSSQSEREREQLDDSLEQIRQSYRYQREDYQDAIDLDTMELALLKEAMVENRLYAGIDGVITYMSYNGLPVGSTITEGDVLIRITDNSSCIFETTRISYTDCFWEGQILQVEMDSGSGLDEVDVTPYDMENWGEKFYFEVVDGENITVKAGAGGNMNVSVDSRGQVLTLPKSVVYSAGVKHFVYVVGEDGFLEVRWVETGLEDSVLVEIVSGLSEGEEVIMR